MPDNIDYRKVTFAEAIKYLRNQLPIPTDRWDALTAEERDVAFTLAKSTAANITSGVHNLVIKAAEEGTTFDQFRKEFRSLMKARGWLPEKSEDYHAWRADLVYQTNLNVAYSAGRYEQMTDPDVLKVNNAWTWNHGDSPNFRPHHKALDGKTFRADDPFWQTMYPGGFGCRCFITSAPLKGEPDKAPNLGTVETFTDALGRSQSITWGPDPGWGHIPGSSRRENALRLIQQVQGKVDPALAKQLDTIVAGLKAKIKTENQDPAKNPQE